MISNVTRGREEEDGEAQGRSSVKSGVAQTLNLIKAAFGMLAQLLEMDGENP